MKVELADSLVGTTIGRYEILERLGAGGMGVVCRARDPQLDREVALKLLLPAAADDAEARTRLLQEARTASRLNHPNICTIHEVGEADGRIFIAMELVAGRPLRALIPERGLPAETVARYGAQIARALAYAHEHHVVHRDLKSANIVVATGGQAKLLDFGLSKRWGEGAADRASVAPSSTGPSTTGVVVGTPQYVAPEVLLGQGAGPRSDIWSLGVVLYEMCAGRLPFGAAETPGVVASILQSNPAALPETLPAGLRSVVLRCLAKDPEQRYRSAGEVAAALEALLPESLSGGRQARAARRLPRRRVVVPLAVVALLVAALVTWWQVWGPGRGMGRTAAHTILILPMQVPGQARDAEYLGRAFSEALAVNLAQTKGVHVMPVPTAAEMGPSGTFGRAQTAYWSGAGRLLVGSLTRDGDSLRVSVNLIDTAANRVLWGDVRTARGGDLAALASSLVAPLAHELGGHPARRYEYFMYDNGPRRMAGSPEMTEAIGTVRRYELPQSLGSTRRLVERFPREPEAHVLRLAALMIDLVARGPDSSRVRVIRGELAALHELDPESPWYDAARAMLAPTDPRSVTVLGQVAERSDLTPAARGAVLAMRAGIFIAAGDTAAAIADAAKAVELDPASDLSLSTLARALSLAGRHRDAAQRVRQALALNPTVVNYWLQLGNCMLKQGQWKEYVADLDRAAALSPDVDAILSAQSDGLACVGRYGEAADCARRALRLQPARWTYGFQLARCYMRTGRWNEAVPLLRPACEAGNPDAPAIRAAAQAVLSLRSGEGAAARERALEAATLRASKSRDYALICFHVLRGEREVAIELLQRFPEMGWVEPALDRDRNLASLRSDPRFVRVASWMRSQPIDRVFSEWGRSP